MSGSWVMIEAMLEFLCWRSECHAHGIVRKCCFAFIREVANVHSFPLRNRCNRKLYGLLRLNFLAGFLAQMLLTD